MAQLTINSIKSSVLSSVIDLVRNSDLKVETSFIDADSIADSIRELVDNSGYEFFTVTYYHEAIELVTSSDFNNYEADDLDFSQCANSLDCVMLEANGIAYQIEQEAITEAIEEVAQRFEEIAETAVNEGFTGDYMQVSSGDCYGWTAHHHETVEGTCIWYNLEGEAGLTAVSGDIGGAYLSACFNI